MRISIDARFYGLENTGLGRYSNNLLANLFSDSDKNEYVVFVTPKYKSLHFPGHVRIVPVSVRHYTLAEQILLPYLLFKHRVDLHYTLHFNAPILSPVPMVVTIHDLIKTHFSDITTSTHSRLVFWLKRLGYRLVMSQVVARARTIITPSHAVKQDIILAYPGVNANKIIPIHEAVDDFTANSPAVARPSHKSTNILFVGNSYPHKNLVGLLSAFTLLCKEGSYKLKLLTKPTPYFVKVLASVSPVLRQNIQIMSAVDDQELAAVYADADVLVTPSFMEGFGLPALEALSLGTRVVASDIPVYREVYGDHVTYCNPFDPLSIRDAIKHSLAHKPTVYRYERTWTQVSNEIKDILL